MQYDCSHVGAKLSGLLLSPRGVRLDADQHVLLQRVFCVRHSRRRRCASSIAGQWPLQWFSYCYPTLGTSVTRGGAASCHGRLHCSRASARWRRSGHPSAAAHDSCIAGLCLISSAAILVVKGGDVIIWPSWTTLCATSRQSSIVRHWSICHGSLGHGSICNATIIFTLTTTMLILYTRRAHSRHRDGRARTSQSHMVASLCVVVGGLALSASTCCQLATAASDLCCDCRTIHNHSLHLAVVWKEAHG